jgi:hypothetical protein
MKLSYSMALFLPPLLSNFDTRRSKTTGETEYPMLRSASLSSDESILPLLSRSNLSKIDCQEIEIFSQLDRMEALKIQYVNGIVSRIPHQKMHKKKSSPQKEVSK